ncbi:MAG: D-glycero-beta-D-manno-heptose 1-phosphate adenylyltransferase [Candidatus Cloacimonetes bacterium]|nr:D-glycero-beta-D-manno-heptose 1-phosphate adenylyltransferase [Candidatus Cloacimonadota bacterium]
MIATREEIADIAQNLHLSDKKIVFTNGCFDLIHRGHIEYLKLAKECGDILIVGLNSDDSVRRLKGVDRPINYEQDRAVVLDNLKSVDYVCIFDEDTPYELISIIKPDVLVKGGDWAIDDIVGSDIVLDRGGEVKSLQFVEGKSTTDIIEKIKNL